MVRLRVRARVGPLERTCPVALALGPHALVAAAVDREQMAAPRALVSMPLPRVDVAVRGDLVTVRVRVRVRVRVGVRVGVGVGVRVRVRVRG